MDDSLEQLRHEVQQRAQTELLSDDTPFLGGLTLGQYLDLPDNEPAQLWEAEAEPGWGKAASARWALMRLMLDREVPFELD